MRRLSHVVRWLVVVAFLMTVTAPAALAQTQGRFRGSVLDESEEPIAGATVRVENAAGNSRILETTTDDAGSFLILGLSSGEWTVTAVAEGYNANSDRIRVTQLSNSPVTIFLTEETRSLEVVLDGEVTLDEEALAGLDPAAISLALENADAAYNAENWDEAIAAYTSILEQLPQMSNLHLVLGNAYGAKGDHEQAIAAFERMLEVDPDNAPARAGIARVKVLMGDLDVASAELEAVALGSDASREDLFNLGEVEFAKGAVDSAAQWYEKAVTLDPRWGKPLFKLALVALNRGNIETAKQYLEKVIAVDPDSEEGAQATATLAALP